MEEPENPELPAPEPPATHWNYRRDPEWSFACPGCGDRIRIVEAIGQHPDTGVGYRVTYSICSRCMWSFEKDQWEHIKAMELLHGA